MKYKFEKGDKVVLKSGGPEMTVQSVGKNDDDDREYVECRYFSSSLNPMTGDPKSGGKSYTEKFYTDIIKPIKSD